MDPTGNYLRQLELVDTMLCCRSWKHAGPCYCIENSEALALLIACLQGSLEAGGPQPAQWASPKAVRKSKVSQNPFRTSCF